MYLGTTTQTPDAEEMLETKPGVKETKRRMVTWRQIINMALFGSRARHTAQFGATIKRNVLVIYFWRLVVITSTTERI